MSLEFSTDLTYKFIGFKKNSNDNDSKIIFDIDKRYSTYNYRKPYKYIQNQVLHFTEFYEDYYYFRDESDNEIAFVYPSDNIDDEWIQESDKWYPIINEYVQS